MANEGVNRLARVLEGRAKKLVEKPSDIDFGVIQNDMSLLLNKFPKPIPKDDYLVCRSVAQGAVDDVFCKTQNIGELNSGEHMHISSDDSHIHVKNENEMQHVHDVLIGNKQRWLQPGDRVLAVWVGDDVCVIDIFLSATVIGGLSE
ncbi:MAG: hypothetical protein FWH05_08750 [Oscillospiraceae bacterium]|nr:hypothetical protein [Oscillospiraceae bacterium]